MSARTEIYAYRPGDQVTITKSGWYEHSTSTRTEWLSAGSVATVVRPQLGRLHVRATPKSTILEVSYGRVEPIGGQPRRLGEVPPGGLSPNDERLAWFWEDAAAYADAVGHCREYDDIVRALDVPGRLRTVTARVEVVPGVVLTGSVKARSRSEAQALLLAKVRAEQAAAMARMELQPRVVTA